MTGVGCVWISEQAGSNLDYTAVEVSSDPAIVREKLVELNTRLCAAQQILRERREQKEESFKRTIWEEMHDDLEARFAASGRKDFGAWISSPDSCYEASYQIGPRMATLTTLSTSASNAPIQGIREDRFIYEDPYGTELWDVLPKIPTDQPIVDKLKEDIATGFIVPGPIPEDTVLGSYDVTLDELKVSVDEVGITKTVSDDVYEDRGGIARYMTVGFPRLLLRNLNENLWTRNATGIKWNGLQHAT